VFLICADTCEPFFLFTEPYSFAKNSFFLS